MVQEGPDIDEPVEEGGEEELATGYRPFRLCFRSGSLLIVSGCA